jgi:hypothetical protein
MNQPVPPPLALQQLIVGFIPSRALFVATKLGIADLLARGPQTADDLARTANADAPSLYRLLRTLASFGVFAEDDDGRFTLTPMAELLRSDVPDSRRGGILQLAGLFYEAFDELEYSIRTGRSAYARRFGLLPFDHVAQDPAALATQRAGFQESQMQAAAVLGDRYDFTGTHTLVDVGGAQGGLLAAILRDHPSMHGILFDTPSGLAGADAVMRDAGTADRVTIMEGDFFKGVPSGGDTYLLMRILRDWDDEQARTILQHCRAVMPPTGRLLVLDPIIPPGNGPSPAKLGDMMLRVLFDGGRDRTEAEFRSLFDEAGFTLVRTVETNWVLGLLEATRAA